MPESEYVKNEYTKILKKARFWILQGSQYASVTQRSDYVRVYLDRIRTEYILGSNYARILNMAEFWICKSYTGF